MTDLLVDCSIKNELEEAKQLKRQRVLASMHLKHMAQNVVTPQLKKLEEVRCFVCL